MKYTLPDGITIDLQEVYDYEVRLEFEGNKPLFVKMCQKGQAPDITCLMTEEEESALWNALCELYPHWRDKGTSGPGMKSMAE